MVLWPPKGHSDCVTTLALERIRSVLATDCGSTTTKAILIERQEDGSFRLTARGEAPTTVEAPFEDVTRGVFNAAREVQELRGRRLLSDEGDDSGEAILRPQRGDEGVDLYISTSSAGGGLQMVVTGVVASMSAESAARAALGAGAIVMDTFAVNDGRHAHERIERIRALRPDMILMAGGVDGGTEKHVVQMAEMLCAANPRPRLGGGFDLPVVYAGNVEVRDRVAEILGAKVSLELEENVRPTLEEENLRPARGRIHDLFLEHVMQQAPGYPELMELVDAPIMPTPGAVGALIESLAEREGVNVLGVDIGGATTDVFSVSSGTFNRTVSANLGMSYSVSNVLLEAGLEQILRWVPFAIDEAELRNRIGNKMIRPTTIPVTLEELQIEQAIAREALRLATEQHKAFAVQLRGVQQDRTIGDAFRQRESGQSLVDMMALDLLIGSGGVLSHAPRRQQSMRMMLDAFLPEGVTALAVDSIFMMPHLGVLATVHPDAAAEVFERDCLVHLGTCIAPVGSPRRAGERCVHVALEMPGGREESVDVRHGELALVDVPRSDVPVVAHITPERRYDVGAGVGKPRTVELVGGVVGVVVDARGRPFSLPSSAEARVAALERWAATLDEYPSGVGE